MKTQMNGDSVNVWMKIEKEDNEHEQYGMSSIS